MIIKSLCTVSLVVSYLLMMWSQGVCICVLKKGIIFSELYWVSWNWKLKIFIKFGKILSFLQILVFARITLSSHSGTPVAHILYCLFLSYKSPRLCSSFFFSAYFLYFNLNNFYCTVFKTHWGSGNLEILIHCCTTIQWKLCFLYSFLHFWNFHLVLSLWWF